MSWQGHRVFRISIKDRQTEEGKNTGWVSSRRYSEFRALYTSLLPSFPCLEKVNWPRKALSKNKPEVVAERISFFEIFSDLCLNFLPLAKDERVKDFFVVNCTFPLLRVRVLLHWNLLEQDRDTVFFRAACLPQPGSTSPNFFEYKTVDKTQSWEDEGFVIKNIPGFASVFISFPGSPFTGDIEIPLGGLPWNTQFTHVWPVRTKTSTGFLGLSLYYHNSEQAGGYLLPNPLAQAEMERNLQYFIQERQVREQTSKIGDVTLLVCRVAPSASFPGFIGIQIPHVNVTELPPEAEYFYFRVQVGKNTEYTSKKRRTELSWSLKADFMQFYYHEGDFCTISFHYKMKALTCDPTIGEVSVIGKELGPSDHATTTPINLHLCKAQQQSQVKKGRLGTFKARMGIDAPPSIKVLASEGELLKNQYSPRLPILFIPGFGSSALNVEKGDLWEGERIWISITKLSSQKVSSSIKNLVTRSSDTSVNRWIKYMSLGPDGISDPEGIQIRAEEGISGCAYLEKGTHAIATNFSYVMGPIINNLKFLGYSDHNLRAAPYDWRVPFHVLEARDAYFSRLESTVQEQFVNTGHPVLVVTHSMGCKLFHYFLMFKKSQPGGQEWIDKYIHTFWAVGAPWLGAPKALNSVVSGVESGLEAFLKPQEQMALIRSLGSNPALFPISYRFHNTFPHGFNTYFYVSGMLQNSAVQPISVAGVQVDGKQVFPAFIDTLLGTPKTQHLPYQWTSYYLNNPFFGKKEEGSSEIIIEVPPVKRFVSSYGVNLDTPKFFFLTWDNANQDWMLDLSIPEHFLPGYTIRDGVAYETNETKQATISVAGINKYCSGDGTVPYDSLSYCHQWKDKIPEFTVHEIANGEHRDVISSTELFLRIVEYACDKAEQ
eukprot:TRINITY_DN7454_c0_g1_i1.p1 TRINITY_DN7454_c0_g1~~TRINITY_DN7454_c0_g1_i1.p1  ORF type:complete len:932 (-),score=165.06 TRINITY_DN7454_c0_g1_i1:108-2765(-)